MLDGLEAMSNSHLASSNPGGYQEAGKRNESKSFGMGSEKGRVKN